MRITQHYAVGRHARYHVLILGIPKAEIMGVVGFMALAANVASVLLLARYKDGDADVRSVWLIRNVAVMIAAIESGAPQQSGRA